jgi:hypothetical protein
VTGTAGPRPDDELWELEVAAALRAGLPEEGPARALLFTDAAIAAARDAEDFGIGPYPMMYLAGCVRSMGLAAVQALPDPMIGTEAVALVREWMAAATPEDGPDVQRDLLFAQWLAVVGTLMDSRRSVRPDGADPPEG